MSYEWISTREAAAIIGVTPETMRAWRRRGDGPPATRFNARRYGYRREDVERWLREQPTAGGPRGGDDGAGADDDQAAVLAAWAASVVADAPPLPREVADRLADLLAGRPRHGAAGVGHGRAA